MHDYRERLHVPLVWWLLAVPTVLIFGATLFAGLAEPWPVIIMAGLAAAYATVLITMGLATVEISDGALRAGGAVLPLTAISKVVSLDEKQSTRLRGPRADPAAYLYSRPYLKESVYLAVDAAGGSTAPYWLIDLGTKVVSAVAAMAAAFVARKVISFVWTKATGKEPPTHPEDPQVALTEALGWSVLTGVSVEAARLLATRAAARRTYSGPDCEPANAADG